MKSTECHCPDCGEFIPLDDINVAQDIALCRSCSKTFSWSEMMADEEDEALLSVVPKHLNVQETAEGVLLTYRKVQIMLFLFMMVFAVFWNGIVYTVLISSILGMWRGSNGAESFHFDSAIFMLIPFMLVGLAVFIAALFLLFGKTKLEVGNGKGILFYGMGNIGRRRHFVLSRDARFEIRTQTYSRGQSVSLLTISRPGEAKFEFGSNMDTDTLEFLRVFLKRMCR